MVWLSLGLVALFLAGGAASLALGGRGFRRASGILALVVAGAGLAAALVLWRADALPALTFSHWQTPALLAGGLSYRADGLARGMALLLGYINLLVTSYLLAGAGASGIGHNSWGWGLAFLGAALSFIFSDSLLAVSLSWGLAALVVLLALAGAPRITWAPLLACLALLGAVGALAAGGVAGNYQNLAELEKGASWVLLVAAVAWMGAYPFHLWPSGDAKARSAWMPTAFLPLMGMGFFALLRAFALGAGRESGPEAWLWLGVVSALGGAFLSWGEVPAWARAFYLVAGQAGFLVLSLALPADKGRALATLGVLNLLLSGAILFLALRPGEGGRWTRPVLVLAGMSLLGLPPLPGFWVRWGVYRELWEMGRAGFILAGMLATFLFCPVLARLGREEGQGKGGGWRLGPLVLLFLPLALGAVYPGVGAHLLPLSGTGWEGLGPWQFLQEGSRRATIWGAILFPLAGGYLVFRLGAPQRSGLVGPALAALARALDVAWILDAAAWALAGLAEGLRRMAQVLEGEHSLGWALLWGLVVAIFLMTM